MPRFSTSATASPSPFRRRPLHLFTEATGPAVAPPKNEVALRSGEKMAELDGYVFVC